jgi:hypothetical protein
MSDYDYQDSSAASGVRYPGLRRLVGVLKLYGYINLVVGVLAFFGLAFQKGMMGGLGAAVVSLLVCWAQGFIILMLSEVPQVFMDIEENTRTAADHLRSLNRVPAPPAAVSSAPQPSGSATGPTSLGGRAFPPPGR